MIVFCFLLLNILAKRNVALANLEVAIATAAGSGNSTRPTIGITADNKPAMLFGDEYLDAIEVWQLRYVQ